MKPTNNTRPKSHRFMLPGPLSPHLTAYAKFLAEQGYTSLTIRGYSDSISHFATWLQGHGKSVIDIGSGCVDEFAKHHCECPGGRRSHTVSAKYVKRIRAFVNYLDKQGVIELTSAPCQTAQPPIIAQFVEHLNLYGLSPSSISRYERSISTLLPELGQTPSNYDSAHIQRVVFDMSQHLNPGYCKTFTTALRSYLRFLAIKGLCSPDLDRTVPTIAQWRLSSMPRYITSSEIENVIAGCDINSGQGLRDRAIILLLARLGLRASEIVNLYIEDVDWAEGLLTVRGKGHREDRLPLLQEVGDAILAYLNQARPAVPLPQMFLCINAPHRPIAASATVSNLVRTALLRAGITNPPSFGAHLLRHSAATTLLREGATLETVSAILRHRSLDMTAYYAKVDIRSLKQIAQPWPEDATC